MLRKPGDSTSPERVEQSSRFKSKKGRRLSPSRKLEFFAETSVEATMEAMDTPFLTLSEAAAKTGRSASTVRRLIKGIADDDTHADRGAVQPSPKEVAAFKKKEENFAWKIREDVLLREFSAAPKEAKKSVHGSSDILTILQQELALKNQQIEKQWEVIHALNDRLREGNILMGSLQKRLALPEAQSPAPEVFEAAPVAVASTEPAKKSSKKAPTPAKQTSTAKSGGFLAWLMK